MTSTTPATESSHRGVLFSMCLALVLVVGTVSAINLALPDLAVDLGASNTDLTWIADSYTVALAALVLPLGALGDRVGRKRLLLIGSAVFGAASLGAALAGTTHTLILWRVLMGAGAAMIMPGTLSTITAAFPPEKRAKGVATWSGFASAGAVLGLLVSGSLLERWGWNSIFFATSAAALVVGLCAWKLAPETRDEEHVPFDVVGGLLLAIGVGGLVFAIIEGSEKGFTHAMALGGFGCALVGFVGYVVAGLRNDHPLLDPRLFALRGFRAGAITILVQFMAVFGFFFVGLQYLQLVLDYSPLRAAIALLPVAVVVVPIAQLTPWLVERLGLKWVMAIGLAAMSAGMLLNTRLDVDSGYLPFLVGLLIAGLGIGLTSSTGTSAITGSLGRDRQGVASAMNDTTREIGSAIGIAVMGSVYGSHYRDALPADNGQLPAQAVEAIRESAAGGIEVTRRLAAAGQVDAAAQLGQVIRVAFIDGLTASLTVIGVVLALAAVAVLIRAPRHLDDKT